MQHNRTTSPGHGQTDRVFQHRSQTLRFRHHHRFLRDWREQRDLIDLLKRVLAKVRAADRAADRNEWRIGQMRLGHSGRQIDNSWARLSPEDDPGAAGDPRVRIGHVTRGALVAGTDISDLAGRPASAEASALARTERFVLG